MDVAVFAAHPAATDKLRRESHEPSIGVAIGGTRLAANLALDVIAMADAACSTSVDNTLQEHEHLVSTLCADDLVHARLELHDEIALIVLDARDKHRCRADAVIGKCGVGADHLSNRHFARSEAERHRGMDIRIVDAIFVQQVNKLLRIELTHQIGGYPVVRLRQSPLQRDHLPIAAAGGVARCPRLAGAARWVHSRKAKSHSPLQANRDRA